MHEVPVNYVSLGSCSVKLSVLLRFEVKAIRSDSYVSRGEEENLKEG